MSGPKKSSYEIRQEIIEQRKREKEEKRAKQIHEIDNRIKDILQKLNKSKISQNAKKNIKNWISEIDTKGDLRDAFRSLRGIESYITKQETYLKDNHKIIEEAKRFEEEVLKDQQKVNQAKIETIVQSLDEVLNDYKEIINDGIIQRIQMFKKSISLNPDNQNTFKQIENFKQQLFKLDQEYKENVENCNYVATAFSSILNSNIQEKGNEIIISGDIDGVPITVKLNQKNNNIDMDTPLDGSCKKALDSMQQRLKDSNINLGSIKVLKTRQVLNQVDNFQDKRIKQ